MLKYECAQEVMCLPLHEPRGRYSAAPDGLCPRYVVANKEDLVAPIISSVT